MPIIARASSGGSYEPIPAGTYTGVCYSIIDLGVQVNEKFGIKSRKIMITWELPDETMEVDGETKPKVIGKEYTLSLSEKGNLRKELEAWRGRAFTKDELDGFDLKNVLGKGCQLQVIHKTTATGKVRAVITAIIGLPKGMKAPEAQNELVYFEIDQPQAIDKISTLPEWIQTKIRQSETWEELKSKSKFTDKLAVAEETEDDCPF